MLARCPGERGHAGLPTPPVLVRGWPKRPSGAPKEAVRGPAQKTPRGGTRRRARKGSMEATQPASYGGWASGERGEEELAREKGRGHGEGDGP
jgi:hypothetical protein